MREVGLDGLRLSCVAGYRRSTDNGRVRKGWRNRMKYLIAFVFFAKRISQLISFTRYFICWCRLVSKRVLERAPSPRIEALDAQRYGSHRERTSSNRRAFECSSYGALPEVLPDSRRYPRHLRNKLRYENPFPPSQIDRRLPRYRDLSHLFLLTTPSNAQHNMSQLRTLTVLCLTLISHVVSSPAPSPLSRTRRLFIN